MKQQLSTASNYSEACDMLRSGYVKHVRLNWNIGSDEFFRIASDWCDTGANFVIGLTRQKDKIERQFYKNISYASRMMVFDGLAPARRYFIR